MSVRLLIIRFENEIEPYEVGLLRGAVNASLEQKQLLFHNHIDATRLRYAYPLIQYKRIGGRAAIVCLGEGVEAKGEFFASNNFCVHIGQRYVELRIARLTPMQYNIRTCAQMFRYRLSRWTPFSQQNWRRFQQVEELGDRITMMERILTGNILSMTKGLGVWLEDRVELRITRMSEPFWVNVKGVKVCSINVEFTTNISLPDDIGLGRHVSIGYGVVRNNKSRDLR